MGKRGPRPTCSCLSCQKCRQRESARRSYYRTAPLNPRRFRQPQLRIPQEATLLAYIAGLIDGEGYVGVSDGRWIVQIGMTDRGVMDWLRGFGGSWRAERMNQKWKELYRWRVLRCRDVLALLTAVRPYLRTKAKAADEAIAGCYDRLQHGEASARTRDEKRKRGPGLFEQED